MKAYGYFCEDKAIEAFIDKTLELIGPATRCKGFIKRTNQLAVPNGRNSSMIKKNFPDAIKLAFSNLAEDDRIDLFIVSYDFDDADEEALALHTRQQKEKIDIKKRGKTVFCIPVQCIEYWLWYIKHSTNETPPIPNSLERDTSKQRKDVKADVYGSASTVTTQLPLSKIILDQLNIEHLRELSTSFKSFTDQIIEFCNRG